MGGDQGVGVRKGVVLRSRFGVRVGALLGERGLTTGELATRAALPVGRVERILRGSFSRLTLREMSIIAGVLGAPLYSLLAPVDPAVEVVPFEIVEERGSGHT